MGRVAVPLRDVSALGCRGSTIWAAGDGGLVKIAQGKAELVRTITRVGTATFTSARAYLATPGSLHVITLATGRERIFHHYGEFATLSVNAGRVAGRLVDIARGRLLDSLLRPVGRIARTAGTVMAVEKGALYVADGDTVRRLRPGGSPATVFARLPGKVVALTSTPPVAAAAWHSCEESANSLLTT